MLIDGAGWSTGFRILSVIMPFWSIFKPVNAKYSLIAFTFSLLQMKALSYQTVIRNLLRKRFRWLFHILFWGLVLLFYTLFFGHQSGNYSQSFLLVSLLLAITIGTSYFFIYFLIPKYFEKQRYTRFILFSVFTVIISLYLETIAAFLMLFWYIFGAEKAPDRTSIDVYFLFVAMYFIIFLVITLKLLISWNKRQKDIQEISRQKLEAELKMLRSQIQPHFLFNSLNSIYALSMKKSDETPDMIIKLSGILDYLLYECDAERVSLEKEIEVIQNYIELQQVRFGDKLKMSFEVKGDNSNLKIAPMLFLPLVENSFKHGVDRKKENAWVNMSIEIAANILTFTITNSNPGTGESGKEHGGIGLSNLEKRLKLLYPGRQSIDIINDESKFEVTLEIELNE